VSQRLPGRAPGSGTLCGFHIYVGADDVGFVPGGVGIRSEPAL